MQAFPKYLTKKLKKKIKISWYVSFYTLFVIFKWLTNQIRFKTWCILPNRSHGWAWFGLELQNSDFYRTKSTKFGKFKSLIFSWHLSSSHDVKMENGSKCLENWYSIPIKFLFCFFFFQFRTTMRRLPFTRTLKNRRSTERMVWLFDLLFFLSVSPICASIHDVWRCCLPVK